MQALIRVDPNNPLLSPSNCYFNPYPEATNTTTSSPTDDLQS